MVKGKAWVAMIWATALACSSASSPPPASGGSGGSVNPGSGGSGGGNVVAPPGGGGDTGTVAACTVLETTTVTNAPGASTRPALAWTGSAYLLVWADQRDGGSDLFMTMLDVHGGRAGGAPDTKIAHMASPLDGPELARLPDGRFMVVFETCASTACDGAMGVGALVLGADGQPSGAPIELVPQAAVQRRPYVAAAFGGAYTTFRDLDGATIVPRVLPLGATGAASGAPVTMGGGAEGLYPHLAANGDHLALVYRRTDGTPDIVLSLLDQSLAVQAEQPVRTGVAADATNPVVVWNGGGWTVAWEDQAQGPDPLIMSTAAAADDTTTFPPTAVSPNNGNWPAIASNGRNAFVVFYGFAGGAQIMLARLDNAGRRVGEILQVSAEPGHGKYPSIAHDDVDDDLGVAWQDDGSGEIGFANVKCP